MCDIILFMKKYRNFIIIVAFVLSMQSLTYFLTKNLISNYNVITSIIDVPLIKSFVYFYNIWYPFVIICSFLIYKDDKDLFSLFMFNLIISTIMAHITFFIYPSIVIRPDIKVTDLTSWIVDFTYKADTPAVNCLPSIHCLYCFATNYYSIKCNSISKRNKIFITIFSSLIVLSTLFIKQHIIEDVILALIYTIISITIIYINKNRIIKLFNKII